MAATNPRTKRFREAALDTGWSRKGIARRLGYQSDHAVTRWFTGQGPPPPDEVTEWLEAVCAVMAKLPKPPRRNPRTGEWRHPR